MAALLDADRNHFDAIVIGAGHNGMICAAYLAKAGLRVALLEGRSILGGPVGTFEFLPGYRTSFTNSPGSFEQRFVQELDLEAHGLRFVRPDPTLVHHFPDGAFVGWRDRVRTEAQLDRFSPGEAGRYTQLLQELEELARALGLSIYQPAPDLEQARTRLTPAQAVLFDAVFHGSLRDLLDWRLRSDQAKALLGMVALNVTMAPPFAPGTAVGLMLRPIAMASSQDAGIDDPRRSALRGSTGLPVGGMGAMIDALEAACQGLGVTFRRCTRVAAIRNGADGVRGVTSESGEEFIARVVVSAINPRAAFRLLDRAALPACLRDEVEAKPLLGSAFKLVIALDGVPRYTGLPDGLENDVAASTQFRMASSLDHIETVIRGAQHGILPDQPLIWALIPTLTSPGLAPAGRHLLSANVWHAPYRPNEGDWPSLRDAFRDRCIDTISALMPDLRARITDVRAMTPVDLETELDLERSHITHGDMLTSTLFGPRPHRLANSYRTPLTGFYVSGAGTWPGGYVTGVPGYNAAQAVLRDRDAKNVGRRPTIRSQP